MDQPECCPEEPIGEALILVLLSGAVLCVSLLSDMRGSEAFLPEREGDREGPGLSQHCLIPNTKLITAAEGYISKLDSPPSERTVWETAVKGIPRREFTVLA